MGWQVYLLMSPALQCLLFPVYMLIATGDVRILSVFMLFCLRRSTVRCVEDKVTSAQTSIKRRFKEGGNIHALPCSPIVYSSSAAFQELQCLIAHALMLHRSIQ